MKIVHSQMSIWLCLLCTISPVAVGQNSSPPTNGCVGWWPGEGNGKDMVGTNDASIQGEVTFTPGKAGLAFGFNGESTAVVVPDSPALALLSECSLVAWIKLARLPSEAGHFMHIVGKSQVNNDLDLQVETDNRVHFFVGPGLQVATTTILQTGIWYSVVATYRANEQIQIYLNGTAQAVAPINYTRTPNPDPLTIGWNAVFPGRFFTGQIDEVAAYDRVLSPSEIVQYLSGIGPDSVGPVSIFTAVEIGWFGETNKNYLVQWASELDLSTWRNLAAPIAGTGAMSYFFDSTRAQPKRFYRVVSQLITNITPADALAMITSRAQDSTFVVLDVRTSSEYASGHIKGARNLDYYSTTFRADLDTWDKNKAYLVYCGSAHRSPLAVAIMQQLGFVQVYNMLNGFPTFAGLSGAAPYLEP